MNGLKTCPFCSEEIKFTAIKCRYCGSMLSGSASHSGSLSGVDLVRQALGDRYEVLEEVGRGGMSAVYKAIQRNLSRPVALKVVHQNLLHDQEFVTRFHREAQVCASLSHPNIVTVYDEGEVSGVHFMAMEYLEGTDLHELIRTKGKLSSNQTLEYIIPVAEALDYAHQKGVIHRDIKSSNIYIKGNGRVVLMDFGIAHAAGSKVTLEGAVIGTPEYMSPEQADGRKVDHHTDLYSLGVVMYECLTGRVPFSGENAVSTIYKLIHEQPQQDGLVKTPASMQELILSLLSKDPEDRLGNASDVAGALRQIQQGKSGQPPRKFGTKKSSKPQPSDKKAKAPERRIPSVVWFLGVIGLLLAVLLVYQLQNTGKSMDEVAQITIEQITAKPEETPVQQGQDTMLNNQAEEEAWVQAQRVSNIASYERYLEIYPLGRYSVEATGMIAQLREQASRQEEERRLQQLEQARRQEQQQQARQAEQERIAQQQIYGNAPVAAFTGSPTSGTSPLTVSFTDQSTNNPTRWSWNFGDGTTSTQRNPTKVYNSPGTYTVSLTVSGSQGSDTHTKNNYITVNKVLGVDWPRDNQTRVVDVTNPRTGKTWMDHNLGASRAATSSTDAQAYGDLYQWGRAADGHQKRSSGTTSTLSGSDTPGHGNFILAPNSPYDWRSPKNNNLWQGVNGINNPCPPGYRLPTNAELEAERQSWGSNNSAGAFSSPLKLLVAGLRWGSNGSLSDVGSSGYYWSSTVVGTRSRLLAFDSTGATMSLSHRAYGVSVRCLKDH